MATLRKLLLTLMVLGAVGSTVSAGTFASFTATTRDPASTFVSGSVVLGVDNVTKATSCLSTGLGTTTNSNSYTACDAHLNVLVRKPGDVAYVDLTLQNLGNLDSTLSTYASQNCASAIATGYPASGGGNACTSVRMTIEEYATALDRTNDNPSFCHYGGDAGQTSCDVDEAGTFKTLSTWHTSTINVTTPLALGAIEAGDSRYFRVLLKLPTTAADTLQGRKATFGFWWALDPIQL